MHSILASVTIILVPLKKKVGGDRGGKEVLGLRDELWSIKHTRVVPSKEEMHNQLAAQEAVSRHG